MCESVPPLILSQDGVVLLHLPSTGGYLVLERAIERSDRKHGEAIAVIALTPLQPLLMQVELCRDIDMPGKEWECERAPRYPSESLMTVRPAALDSSPQL